MQLRGSQGMKHTSSEGGDHGAWNVYIARVFAFVVMALFAAVCINGALEPHSNPAGGALLLSEAHRAPTARKLLTASTTTAASNSSDIQDDDGYGDGEGGDDGSMNRVGMGSKCSKDNILVFQGATSPLPNGIPTYTVEIHNVCLSGSCSISDIHMSCGWFGSARLVNPRVFRRIQYNDCLVNNGEPLNPGDALSFQYANSFKYPLSVASVSC